MERLYTATTQNIAIQVYVLTWGPVLQVEGRMWAGGVQGGHLGIHEHSQSSEAKQSFACPTTKHTLIVNPVVLLSQIIYFSPSLDLWSFDGPVLTSIRQRVIWRK